MRIARPDTLRRYHERLRSEGYHQGDNGRKPSAEETHRTRALEGQAMRQMMETQGWKLFLKALIDDEIATTRALADPQVNDEQAAVLRRDIIGVNYALRKLEYLVRLGDEATAYLEAERNGRPERRG